MPRDTTDRSLEFVGMLLAHPEGFTARQFAEAHGLHFRSAYRYVPRLQSMGVRLTAGEGFQLTREDRDRLAQVAWGPRPMELSMLLHLVRHDPQDPCVPLLTRYMESRWV